MQSSWPREHLGDVACKCYAAARCEWLRVGFAEPWAEMSFHRSVHISLWQGALHAPEVSTWEKQLQRRAREAKEKGAEILLTPELMVPGYDFFGKNGFHLEASKIEAAIQACALDCDIALCVGYAEAIGEEKMPGKTHWNTAIVVDRQGKVVMRYRKHHCWGNEGNLGLQESCDALQVAHPETSGCNATRFHPHLL